MNIHHHPSEELLLAYAAGDLGEAWSLVVATHTALCPLCRAQVRDAEAIGGVLVDDLEPVSMSSDSLERTLARLAGAPERTAERATDTSISAPVLPEPLRSYAGGDAGDLRWRPLGRGAYHVPLVRSPLGETARLLRIPAGRPVPEHGHNGLELTMVLSGSFTDRSERFARGDVETADGDLVHQPIADAGEDCICLAVTDAPLRFRSRMARLVQPLIGI